MFNIKKINSAFFKHPLTLILVFHTLWIGVSCFNSYNMVIAIKFFLAKVWYVVTFYFLAGMILKNLKSIKIIFWSVYIPLFIITCIILVRHSAYHFDYKNVNHIFYPFFRNHVDYACLLALIFPYIFFSVMWYKKWSNKWLFLVFGLLFIFIAINLSYTRAAVLAIFIAGGAYYIIKKHIMKPTLIVSFVGLVCLIYYLGAGNKYLRLAPNYEKVVTHQSYESLLEATYKLEDISTMERVYRWVAAFQMFKKEPVFGFGPGNFYENYKSFTISSFKTYVSRNPEKSGVHSYYLMTLVEQGVVGFSIFMFLIFYALAKGEMVYHTLKDRESRLMLLAGIMSLIVILSLLLINDMIETDKVGPFFFVSLVIITNMDLKSKGLLDEKTISNIDPTSKKTK
jgi:O-antigen ligase